MKRPLPYWLAALAIVGALLSAGWPSGASAVENGPPSNPSAASASFSAPTWVAQAGEPGRAEVYPWGMATETDGTILVGDYLNGVIRILKGGALVSSFGLPADLAPEQPYSIAVDSRNGTVYVANAQKARIDVFSGPADGYAYETSYQLSASDGGPISTGVYVAFLAVDPLGNVWAVNTAQRKGYTNEVYELTPLAGGALTYSGLSFTTSQGASAGGAFRGITFGTGPCLSNQNAFCNDLYLLDAGYDNLEVIDPTVAVARPSQADAGLVEKIGFSGPGSQLGALGGDIRDVAVDSSQQRVYVTDPAQEQVEVYNLAGTPLYHWGGSGVAATDLGGVRDITIGPQHDLFIADYGNFRVDEWTPYVSATNAPSLVSDIPAVSAGAPPGGLNDAVDVAVSAQSGHVFVADTFNQRIQEFSPLSAKSTSSQLPYLDSWGVRATSGTYAMDYPRGIAVDPTTGDVVVDNTQQGNILIYGPGGSDTPPLLANIGTFGQDYQPPYHNPEVNAYSRGVLVTGAGMIYVADSGNDRLKLETQDGQVSHVAECGSIDPGGPGNLVVGCSAVAQGPSGDVYAAAPHDNAIYVYSSSLKQLSVLQTPVGFAPGDLNVPYGVAVNAEAKLLYVSENGADRIDVYDISSPAAPVWSGSWGTTGSAHGQFAQPAGIAVDSGGNIYVADSGNNRVEIFSK